MQNFSKLGALIASIALVNVSVFAASIDQVINAGVSRADQAASAQKRVVAMAEETDRMIIDYKAAVKTLDGLKIYTDLQKKQIDNQEAEKTNLTESIGKIGDIERNIVPLMAKMIDSLQIFVENDMPFLLDERRERVAYLDEVMERADVSRAEKLRKVLEAYTIETDFGNTIEHYKDKIEVEPGKEMQVDFLRIGRVSLSYQSEDGNYTAGYNPATKAWEPLSPAEFKTQVATGIKIARKEISPDLFIVPVPAAQGAK